MPGTSLMLSWSSRGTCPRPHDELRIFCQPRRSREHQDSDDDARQRDELRPRPCNQHQIHCSVSGGGGRAGGAAGFPSSLERRVAASTASMSAPRTPACSRRVQPGDRRAARRGDLVLEHSPDASRSRAPSWRRPAPSGPPAAGHVARQVRHERLHRKGPRSSGKRTPARCPRARSRRRASTRAHAPPGPPTPGTPRRRPRPPGEPRPRARRPRPPRRPGRACWASPGSRANAASSPWTIDVNRDPRRDRDDQMLGSQHRPQLSQHVAHILRLHGQDQDVAQRGTRRYWIRIR